MSTEISRTRTRILGAGTGSWHIPLLALAALMAASAIGCLIGVVLDPRVLTGQPIWMKPLKFSISLMIYALTWGWLIPQLRRFRRIAWWAGTFAGFFLLIEIIVVVLQVIRGTSSHYNVSTDFNATLWSIMGGSVMVIWVATMIISALLFFNPGPDSARNLAIRLGALIALLGMGLAFLMTTKQTGIEGVAGAHSVGLPDGGPSIPFLGWSSVGGDLRIPHFVGMHGLQVLALIAIALELWSRNGSGWLAGRLQEVNRRTGVIAVLGTGYLALVALVTWQALRGQSLVQPDLATMAAATGLLLAVGSGCALVLRRPLAPRNTLPGGVTP